jgi:hypothetical protein
MLDTLRQVRYDYTRSKAVLNRIRSSKNGNGIRSRIAQSFARGGTRMNYDDWKLESPEDEDERLNGPRRRRQARLDYLADQRDEFLEAEQMEKNNDETFCDD